MLARVPFDVWIAALAALGTLFAAVYEISVFAALCLYLGLAALVVVSVIDDELKL